MKSILIFTLTFGLNSFALAVSNPVNQADCKSSASYSFQKDSKKNCTLKIKTIKHEVAKRKGCDVPELCFKKNKQKVSSINAISP